MAFMGRGRVCKFCEDRTLAIDYKNVKLIRKFVNDQGKIIPGRVTGHLLQAPAAPDRSNQAGAKHCVNFLFWR